MKIEILGTGCPKCKKTFANAKQAIKELGIDAEVTKIFDVNQITERGVFTTPALAIDGEVEVSGKIPGVEEIKKMLGS